MPGKGRLWGDIVEEVRFDVIAVTRISGGGMRGAESSRLRCAVWCASQ
jgi:hypothetical protein